MSADPTTVIASLGVEPTYSAQEASAMLGRSYSWLDQRLRAGQFIRTDGTTVRPIRTAGGYRRFTLAMLRDIATCSYRHSWFTMDALKLVLCELAMAAHRETGDYKIPSSAPYCGRLPAVFKVSSPSDSGAAIGASQGLIRQCAACAAAGIPRDLPGGALLGTALCRGVRLSADPGHRDDSVVCSQLRPHPPRHPAGELHGTVLSIRSRAAVSQYQCRAAERSAGLRARTLVARSIENAGTAHSVVFTFSHDKQPEATPHRRDGGCVSGCDGVVARTLSALADKGLLIKYSRGRPGKDGTGKAAIYGLNDPGS
jgi:hypothetical protein